ncbi:arginyl-tRNA--protein transferase 2 isoform X2 [Ricinus communis]|uniref:Arginyl-tRNA--protein transferase n=1 Tax=Ricinus communis TaxID=3988 RepID=B9SLM9_RICCO|nr:arginyl-tRNA--protein transferase 2 isoform X2 [Ricinus communis]EEF35529.1 Arginyl-tRNA--protein transferase, putative [Ricinus communis]|eukprot:XP_002526898.1 arginyl-tRNA--protein transferase 2 isoform X1 [Ricinus communis]
MAGKVRRSDASSSSSSNSRGETVVVDCGRRKSSCGYCRSGARTSISHGLWAHSISVDDYQDLLDRGWRRSGCFLYKPEMERTCCPSYTIRLRASDFVPLKEQLRVFRKMQRFLDGTLDVKKSMEVVEDPNILKDKCSCACHEVSSSGTKENLPAKNEERNSAQNIATYLSDQVDIAIRTCAESGDFPCSIQLPKSSIKQVSQAKRKLLIEGAEELMYSSNIAFQLVATIRRAESAGNNASHSAGDLTLSPKVIAEKLAASLNQLSETSGFSIRACNGHINFYASRMQASSGEGAQTIADFKESAAGCKRKSCCTRKSVKHPQGKRQKLEIRLKRSSFDPEEFELYRRYQMKVHNDAPDHVTESSYKRFLVDTPLVSVPPSGNVRVPPCGFGSFHQQYVINGQLVAVGVIDILPKCLSSKYLFWDPDFAFLSLGKYSALQEIGWVKENQLHCPSLQYYYLGYYIHSCSKMRYKAAYRPSELLCPLRYQWVPFDIARPLLDRKPYAVLTDYALLENAESLPPHSSENAPEMQHDDNGGEDSNDILMDDGEEMIEPESESSDDESSAEMSSQTLEDGDVGDILIGLKGSRVRYKELRRAFDPSERSYLESQLHRYKSVVGAELSERIVYSLG